MVNGWEYTQTFGRWNIADQFIGAGFGTNAGGGKPDSIYQYVPRTGYGPEGLKANHELQEQFSEDWDYCERDPVSENIDTYGQVAGHYGPASNVYHVGLVSPPSVR